MTLLISPSSHSPRDMPDKLNVKLHISPLLGQGSQPRSPAESARQAWETPRSPLGFLELHQTKLEDPFLAQYIKEPHSNLRGLLNDSLRTSTSPKVFEYVQQYLKPNKRNSLSIPSVSRSPTLHRVQSKSKSKSNSPLRHHVVADVEMSDDSQSLDPDSQKDRRSSVTMGKSEANNRKLSASSLSVHGSPNVSSRDLRRRARPLTESPVPGAKKLHPQTEIQTLSQEFSECPTPTLVKLITRMLQSLINLNDRNVPAAISSPTSESGHDGAGNASSDFSPDRKNKLLTRYHSRTPPAISIETYISRLVKFNNFTQANLLLTIYYIDLLSHNFQPYFTLNSWTVHRFLLVATMLAQKALEDFFYTNDHYAKVGGVALTELNCLELDFLNRVDWKVVPAKQILGGRTSIRDSKEVLDMYYWQLVTLMGKNVTQQNNMVYVFPENSAPIPSRF